MLTQGVPRIRSFALLTLLVAACGALGDELAYPGLEAPRSLASSPAEAGLVVVECRIEEHDLAGPQEIGLEGGALARVDGGERLHTAPVGALLVFDGVTPGRWRLASVRSAAWRAHRSVTGRNVEDHDPRTYTLPRLGVGPDGEADPLELDVVAGGLHYVGRVTVSGARSRTESLADLRPSRQGELRAWQRLSNAYPDSAWVPLIEARIAELESTP